MRGSGGVRLKPHPATGRAWVSLQAHPQLPELRHPHADGDRAVDPSPGRGYRRAHVRGVRLTSRRGVRRRRRGLRPRATGLPAGADRRGVCGRRAGGRLGRARGRMWHGQADRGAPRTWALGRRNRSRADHWVDPSVGWAKAARLLRPGGMLALVMFITYLDEETGAGRPGGARGVRASPARAGGPDPAAAGTSRPCGRVSRNALTTCLPCGHGSATTTRPLPRRRRCSTASP